jgi:general secretion pathway protein H
MLELPVTAKFKPFSFARVNRRERGFTLLELLVVLVIVGLLLGLATFSATPGASQAVQREAQRLALLLQLARDEAIVRNRPIAFETDGSRYRFLLRDNNAWRALPEENLLREREFALAPLTLSLTPAVAESAEPLRLIFGREPVDKPFVLTLAAGAASASIAADGVGHFTVNAVE